MIAARLRHVRYVCAVPPDDTAHEVIACPLSDERREPDDEVAVVGVAHEREPADAGELVLAARAALAQDRVQASSEGAEAISVEVEAADLPAERVDVGAGIGPRREREPLHRVEVDVEAGEPGVHGVVELAHADDRDADAEHLETASFEPVEVLRAGSHRRLVGREHLSLGAPAEVDVMRGAGRPERGVGVERDRREEIRRRERSRAEAVCRRGAGHDRAGPCFAERAVVESDELLRVADALGEGAPWLRRRELGAVASGADLTSASEHRRDDERPEAWAHAVLVDPDVERPRPRGRLWSARHGSGVNVAERLEQEAPGVRWPRNPLDDRSIAW